MLDMSNFYIHIVGLMGYRERTLALVLVGRGRCLRRIQACLIELVGLLTFYMSIYPLSYY